MQWLFLGSTLLPAFLLLATVSPTSGYSDSIDNGQPRIKPVDDECDSYDITLPMSEWDVGDPQPWAFKSGSSHRLCCGVRASDPILKNSVSIEWLFFTDADQFATNFNKILSNSSSPEVTITEKSTSGPNSCSVYSYLSISAVVPNHAGVYMCRATGFTASPPNNGQALSLGRVLDPFYITVYDTSLAFSEEYDGDELDVDGGSYLDNPYWLLNYGVTRPNPNQNLTVEVTEHTNLQYTWMEELLLFVVTPSQASADNKYSFGVRVSYQNDPTNGIERVWKLKTAYETKKDSVKLAKRFKNDDEKFEYELLLSETPISMHVAIGDCGSFSWTFRFESDSVKRQLDPSSGVERSNAGKMDLYYKITDVFTEGRLKAMSNVILVSATCDSCDEVRGHLKVSCGETDGAERLIVAKAKPTFDNGGLNNCIMGEDWKWEDSMFNKNTDTMIKPDTGIPKSVCCKGAQRTTALWVNGKFENSFASGNNQAKIIDRFPAKDTFPDKDALELERYSWFNNYTGYYQCFIKGQLQSQGEKGHWLYRPYKKAFTMGFDYNYRKETVNLEVVNVTSGNFSTATSSVRDLSYLVTKNSCVMIRVKAEIFPLSEAQWNQAVLYKNSYCNETVNQKSELRKYTSDPYDTVKVTIEAFFKPVSSTSELEVGYNPSPKSNKLILNAVEPFLDKPEISREDTERAGGIKVYFLKCIVKGFPISSVTLRAVSKDNSSLAQYTAGSPTEDPNKISITAKGIEVELKAEIKEHGEYECVAVNYLVETPISTAYTYANPESGNLSTIIAAVMACLVLLILLWLMSACLYMARHRGIKYGQALFCCCGAGIKPYVPLHYKKEMSPRDRYLIAYEAVNQQAELGKGNFGKVTLGTCTILPDFPNAVVKVALKEVPIEALDLQLNEDALRRETSVMLKLRNHINVAKILAYTDEPDRPSIIMEYAPYGSLDRLLRGARKVKTDGYAVPDETLTNPIECFEPEHIMEFGKQIASGMEYITKNSIVHRDLAARNILTSGERPIYTMKITDFGLSREANCDGLYEMVPGGKKIPIKWTACESLKYNQYSTKSDVWSFGVVLWELCTLGGDPYHPWDNNQTKFNVEAGKRLVRPPTCKDNLWDLMMSCWHEKPDDRPSFTELYTTLAEFIGQPPSHYMVSDALYQDDLDLRNLMHSAEPPPSASSTLESGDCCSPGSAEVATTADDLPTTPSNEYTSYPLPDNAV